MESALAFFWCTMKQYRLTIDRFAISIEDDIGQSSSIDMETWSEVLTSVVLFSLPSWLLWPISFAGVVSWGSIFEGEAIFVSISLFWSGFGFAFPSSSSPASSFPHSEAWLVLCTTFSVIITQSSMGIVESSSFETWSVGCYWRSYWALLCCKLGQCLNIFIRILKQERPVWSSMPECNSRYFFTVLIGSVERTCVREQEQEKVC